MTQYLISGKLRRQKKKELAGLSDSDCQKSILKAQAEIKELELELSKPSLDIQRDSKLNELGI